MAFFFGGVTSTASDQSSSSNSFHTGSLPIPASISASARLLNFLQSVFPRLGSSRETTVIFFSFITSCSPRRNQPAILTAEGANDDCLIAIQETENHETDLASTVRSADE